MLVYLINYRIFYEITSSIPCVMLKLSNRGFISGVLLIGDELHSFCLLTDFNLKDNSFFIGQ